MKNRKKLAFPSHLLVTPYKIKIFSNGVTKEGGSECIFSDKGKCIFTEKNQVVINSESKKIHSSAFFIVKGDIAAGIVNPASGEAEIAAGRYEIAAVNRYRNPDGSIFSSEVFLK